MTQCMNPEPHDPHPWAIEPNPGEDGPDRFHCDGVRPGAWVRTEPPLDTGCKCSTTDPCPTWWDSCPTRTEYRPGW